MPNRARNYMDRMLGRNEGNESRDFTDGRNYGEEQRFYDDESRDQRDYISFDRERDQRGNYDRNHRTQASRNTPQRGQDRIDRARDYNVRHRGDDGRDYNARGFDYDVQESDDRNSFWNDNFNSERERGMRNRPHRNDSFATNDFRNTENRGGFFGKGPKGWKRSDERVKEEVSEALYRDYNVDASDIEVDVKDGVVTLSGTVDSRQAKRAAEECIENLSGVVDVHNRIRIQDNQNVSAIRSNPGADEKRSLS